MKRLLLTFTMLLALIASLVAASPVAAQDGGGTVTGDKTLSETDIDCGGVLEVTLTLVAQTGIAGDPEDIILVLDRSGSMGINGGQPLADLKTAANTFVDIIDEATDGVLDGTISNGSRVGVVSFADGASLDVPLTSDANAVKTAINALSAGGNTNHQDAIDTAQTELAGSQLTNSKQMILFTDGVTTAGGDANAAAAAARAAGTEIFCIGLGSVSVTDLNEWATDPDSTHVFIAPTSGELEDIFEAIGAAITVPAATNIKVVDTVNDYFAVSNPVESKGSVVQNGNELTWTIDELSTETVTLTYTATHDCTQPGGTLAVNDSVTYTDDESHTLTFPDPTVNVRGCAASLALTPETDTNELCEDDSHSVTATVFDDFGDPVEGITVDFNIISGPNAGKSGSSDTDASGQAIYEYTAEPCPDGLGTDVIEATVDAACGIPAALSDTAEKDWLDTTPPEVECVEAVNPHGQKVPPAGSTTLPGSKGGQNEDGFYQLNAYDCCDPNPQIYVEDTGSGTVFGPFAGGTVIKYTEDSEAVPEIKKMGSDKGEAGAVSWHIIGNGDPCVSAVDASGNKSDCMDCLVPPPPK